MKKILNTLAYIVLSAFSTLMLAYAARMVLFFIVPPSPLPSEESPYLFPLFIAAWGISGALTAGLVVPRLARHLLHMELPHSRLRLLASSGFVLVWQCLIAFLSFGYGFFADTSEHGLPFTLALLVLAPAGLGLFAMMPAGKKAKA